MLKEKPKGNRSEGHIKKPIQRSVFVGTISFMLVLSVLLAGLSIFIFWRTLYENYNAKIESIITYVENNTDADDLKHCLETGVRSEKYLALQQFLNGIVDDLDMEYLYIVIPKEEVLVNAISATSEAEREAGEEDMPLLFETDAYSKEELARYRSFWNKKEISYFRESSDYGYFYTGCKPLRDSNGETVALICVDLSIEALRSNLIKLGLFGVLITVVLVALSGFIIIYWLRKKVTEPILVLEESTRKFANKSRDIGNIDELHYDAPAIRSENEVQSLSVEINKMANAIRDYVERIVLSERTIAEKEQENRKWEAEAMTAKKISDLQNSISSLLINMPALTFSKDINTGKYLACNQAFAEYANKATPEEVVGLTDRDIFDKETAIHFETDDLKTIRMKTSYTFVEDAKDALGNPRQFQTTKLIFTDTKGRKCLLGMSLDITETMKVREAYDKASSETVTYSNIARALAVDYSYLYYIDLTTDSFIEFSTDTDKEELGIERRGEDFFAQSRKDARMLLHPDDQAAFIEAFTKENILYYVDKNGTFTLTYRLMTKEIPIYVNMKISRMVGDGNHLIIGVNNVDAQMKQQKAYERVKEERITYARITALSGDFLCIYTVDPVSDKYTEYSATSDYAGLGLAKEGQDFFEESRKESANRIYPEDMNRFVSMFTKTNVLGEIKRNKVFVLDYRLMIDGMPMYVSLKAALVKEEGDPQLIIGVSNVDAQKKREQEYDYKLLVEHTKANVDALTGVKNKHAYIDMESEFDRQIEDMHKELTFAVVVFDVNDLKKMNDTQGHRKGDLLIKQACEIICNAFKHSPVFRVGGDEFAVLAQGHDYEKIDSIMEQIDKINEDHCKTGGAVVACGMAKFNEDKNLASVFERADIAMYENKKKLKNMKNEN